MPTVYGAALPGTLPEEKAEEWSVTPEDEVPLSDLLGEDEEADEEQGLPFTVPQPTDSGNDQGEVDVNAEGLGRQSSMRSSRPMEVAKAFVHSGTGLCEVNGDELVQRASVGVQRPLAQACGRCGGSCIFAVSVVSVLSAGVLASLSALPGEWKYKATTETWYLSSLGLGVVTWSCLLATLVVLFLVYGILFVCLEASAEAAKSEKLRVKKALRLNDVRAVFGHRPNWRRCFKFGQLVARAVLNIVFATFTFVTLPSRDPDEPLNQTKHVLSWLEFPAVWSCVVYCLSLMLYMLARYCLGAETNTRSLCSAVDAMRAVAQVSMLKFMLFANPDRLRAAIERYRRTTGLGMLVLLIYMPLYLLILVVGTAAFILKASTVAFTSDTLFWSWTPSQWLSLAGLLNNLAGMVNFDDVGSNAVIKHFLRAYTDKEGALHHGGVQLFRSALSQQLLREYNPVLAAVMYQSTGLTDVMDLLQADEIRVILQQNAY